MVALACLGCGFGDRVKEPSPECFVADNGRLDITLGHQRPAEGNPSCDAADNLREGSHLEATVERGERPSRGGRDVCADHYVRDLGGPTRFYESDYQTFGRTALFSREGTWSGHETTCSNRYYLQLRPEQDPRAGLANPLAAGSTETWLLERTIIASPACKQSQWSGGTCRDRFEVAGIVKTR